MGLDLKKEIKLSELRPRLPRPQRARKTAVPVVPALPLMRAFNLVPREEAKSRQSRGGAVPVAVALVGVVLLGGLATVYLSASTGVTDQRAEVEDLRSRVAAAEAEAAPEAAAPSLDPALVDEKRARTAALSGALAGRTAWDRVLRSLSLVLPEDVWFTGVLGSSVVPEQPADPAAPAAVPLKTVTINGFALAHAQVAQFLSRLAVVPELGSVQLLSSTVTKLGEREVVQFSIVAAVKDGGGAA
jgi:Tfp pilus assembly protein PilN